MCFWNYTLTVGIKRDRLGKENRDGAGLQFNWRLWKRKYWQRISLPGFFSYCEVSEKNITANITLKILSMHFIVVEYPISLLLHHSLTLWTCASSWTTFVFCKYIFYMDSISSRKGRFYIKATKFIPHQRIKPSSEVLLKKKKILKIFVYCSFQGKSLKLKCHC